MTGSNSLIVAQKELTEIFRDKRAFLQAVLIPLGFCPVVAYFLFVIGKQTASAIVLLFCHMFALTAILLNAPTGISLTTGEKERNTIESTLTLCVSRTDLVLGKYWAIVATNAFSAFIMFISASVAWFTVSRYWPGHLPEIGGLGQRLAICYAIYALLAVLFFSSLVLAVGLSARNTREATGFINVLFMLAYLVPGVGAFFGLKLTWLTTLLPFVNCNLVSSKFLESSVDWHYWLILFASMILYAGVGVRYAIRLIKDDKMLTPP